MSEHKYQKIFFSRSIVNGITFFGIGLMLFALSFVININALGTLILSVIAYAYFVASIVAFFFPNLSE